MMVVVVDLPCRPPLILVCRAVWLADFSLLCQLVAISPTRAYVYVCFSTPPLSLPLPLSVSFLPLPPFSTGEFGAAAEADYDRH